MKLCKTFAVSMLVLTICSLETEQKVADNQVKDKPQKEATEHAQKTIRRKLMFGPMSPFMGMGMMGTMGNPYMGAGMANPYFASMNPMYQAGVNGMNNPQLMNSHVMNPYSMGMMFPHMMGIGMAGMGMNAMMNPMGYMGGMGSPMLNFMAAMNPFLMGPFGLGNPMMMGGYNMGQQPLTSTTPQRPYYARALGDQKLQPKPVSVIPPEFKKALKDLEAKLEKLQALNGPLVKASSDIKDQK